MKYYLTVQIYTHFQRGILEVKYHVYEAIMDFKLSCLGTGNLKNCFQKPAKYN